ncbi:hypothetical protein GCM10009754_39780 [Amycolatopsis minnesotensis]|uniref:Uncharacterized protein n=1 Tax=Amycolatopsis minnesotensis TaxID=337894 RepID=A0ABN2R624_9PSEU
MVALGGSAPAGFGWWRFVPLFVGEGLKNQVLFGKSAMDTDHRTAKSGGISGNPGLSGGMRRLVLGLRQGSR